MSRTAELRSRPARSIYTQLDNRAFSLLDRKSTRLNSSHSQISYAVFCLKKKNINAVHIIVTILYRNHTSGCEHRLSYDPLLFLDVRADQADRSVVYGRGLTHKYWLLHL